MQVPEESGASRINRTEAHRRLARLSANPGPQGGPLVCLPTPPAHKSGHEWKEDTAPRHDVNKVAAAKLSVHAIQGDCA